MGTKGYQSYRGRRRGKGRGLVILLVLVLLAACAFIFLQNYVTYADDGSWYIDLPFFRVESAPPEETQDNGDARQDVNVVIDQPEEEEEPNEPEPVYEERRLVELTRLPGDGAALRAELEQAGANGFVYPVRDNTGRVFYTSAASLRSAVADGAAGTEKLTELCGQEDVISVARFNCFHDSYYAWANMESAGICQSTGYIWYDNLSYHWLDPDKQAARDYVISLALECAEMGFDELLLEDMCYPSSGKLEKIDYSGNTLGKADALAAFLTELRAALEPYDIKVSLLLDGRLLTAQGDEAYVSASGLELVRLLPLVDAVYARVEDETAASGVLASAAGEGAAPALVRIVSEAAADTGSWCLAAE